MIDHFRPDDNSGSGFIVMPNRAMSWSALVTIYLMITTVTLTVGVTFYLLGYTLILPFSGLEVLALGIALYISAWRGGVQEVILFTDDSVLVERGHRQPEQRYEFQRAWVNFVLERSWNSWYPSRLLLRSHGRQLEIGRFLNEQERQGLARLLCSAVNRDNEKNNAG